MSRPGLRKVAFLSAALIATLLASLESDDPSYRSVQTASGRPTQFLERLGSRAALCLNSLVENGRGAYLAQLASGAPTPGIEGVDVGSRIGDIITVYAGREGLESLAAHPAIEQIEAAKQLKSMNDVSTGSTIGVRGTGAADIYTYQGVAGETLTIVVHGEGGGDTTITAFPAGLTFTANGGPGTDDLAGPPGTLTTSGPQTITVGSSAGFYTLVLRSSRQITTGTLSGGDITPANGVFYLGTSASVVRSADGLTGAGVAVGIIDTGIDFVNADFRNADGTTRIHSIWDQTSGRAVGESFPPGFNYGVEYSRIHIDNHLNGSLPGYVRQSDSSGHGTAVAGVVAGDGSNDGLGRFAGAAPEATLIVVKTFGSAATTIDAINYVYNKARAAALPCVINISLGTHDGPHDGTSLLDQAIDAFAAAGHVVIVVAAGNAGAAADTIHDEMNLPPSTSLLFEYAPDPGTFSFKDISDDLVISEVQTNPIASQFVEIYNPTEKSIDIGLYVIQISDGLDSNSANIASVPLGTFIPPFSFFLFAKAGVFPQPDVVIPPASSLFVGSGHVRLISGGASVSEVDKVGYGGALTPEGTGAPSPGAGLSIERKPGIADPAGGNGVDSDDNGADFNPAGAPGPQNSTSAPEAPKTHHLVDLWAPFSPAGYAVKIQEDPGGAPTYGGFIAAADPGESVTVTGIGLDDPATPAVPPLETKYLIENQIDSPGNGMIHIRLKFFHNGGENGIPSPPTPLPDHWGITVINLETSGSTRTVHIFASNDIGEFSPTIKAANADGTFSGTISEPGTSNAAITVGAFVSRFRFEASAGTQERAEGVGLDPAGNPRMGNLATFSGRGPTLDGRVKPDITAPGAWIGTSRNIPGTYPTTIVDAADGDYAYWGNVSFSGLVVLPIDQGGLSRFSGTSFSSAEVTGVVALILDKNSALDNQFAMKNLLMGNAASDAQTDNDGGLPNNSWGAGKVSAFNVSSVVPQANFLFADNIECGLFNLSSDGGVSPLLALLALTGAAILAFSCFRPPFHGSLRS